MGNASEVQRLCAEVARLTNELSAANRLRARAVEEIHEARIRPPSDDKEQRHESPDEILAGARWRRASLEAVFGLWEEQSCAERDRRIAVAFARLYGGTGSPEKAA